MKKTFFEFLKEIIPVIVGILIALFINNWNEQRKEKRYLNQIFKSIKLELTESKIDIEKNIPKQKKLIDSLKHYTSDNEMSILQILNKVDGVHAPKIRTNSWKAISNTKIELVDYDRLSVLNNISEEKELMEDKVNYLMNPTYSNINDTSKERKEQMILLLMDIIVNEHSIKQEIEKISK